MSERIDHAAEAREWIDAAARHPGAVSTAVLAAGLYAAVKTGRLEYIRED